MQLHDENLSPVPHYGEVLVHGPFEFDRARALTFQLFDKEDARLFAVVDFFSTRFEFVVLRHLSNRALNISADIFGQAITAVMTHQKRIGMRKHHVQGFAPTVPAPQRLIDDSPATFTPVAGILWIV
jgi:hypothetical protein